MRRAAPILIACLGIAILVVGALFVIFKQRPSSSFAGQEPRVATSTIAEETDAYEVDVQYPQFGLPAIDAQIKKDIEGAFTEFKNHPPLPPDSAAIKNAFEGRFDRVYVGPDIVSVELVLSFYTGGAHPLSLFSGATFDRKSGKRLDLKDALAMIGKTTEEVSVESATQLSRALGDDFLFPEGVNTNPENFSSFLISEDAVTFIFQQYQVAPYSAGPQEVRFERVK